MLPEHSPFTTEQKNSLQQLLAGFTPAQAAWLAGYLSAAPSAPQTQPAGSAPRLTILYGSESGNSEKLADIAAREARKKGYKPEVKNMADCSPNDLKKSRNLAVIVSTWGEGEPPGPAAEFYKQFMSQPVALADVRFTVCALGDTSYAQFCQTGKDFDARLESLGARRVAPRQDCDVDFDEPFQTWLNAAFQAFGEQPAVANGVAVATQPATTAAPSGEPFGKKNPFPAELLERVLLNGKHSAKETWHYEISLDGSSFTYEPGDALAVVPVNAPDIVEGILSVCGFTGTEPVELKDKGTKPLADALAHDLDITSLTRPVLTKLQAIVESEKLGHLLADDAKDDFKNYLWGRWIVDALQDFSAKSLTPQQLVSILRKLPPRLYSIASSPLAHPGEVHLTVASVRYQAHGAPRKGVASTYLADMVQKGATMPVFMHENKNFRLPSDSSTPVIMIGPGTGVAPFRAFVEHRAAQGQTGRNWLFFGDQHFTHDFLYQLEWQEHLKTGALTRLDVAFSRDQPEKIYVQDRIRERARDLYAWLEEGAHFYVCGDASRMAVDVHEALISIYETQGNLSREDAETRVADLKKSKRYQRDVY